MKSEKVLSITLVICIILIFIYLASYNKKNNVKESFFPIIKKQKELKLDTNYHHKFLTQNLGWRNIWKKNNTTHNVNYGYNIKDIPTRKYLDNLENVRNVYLGKL